MLSRMVWSSAFGISWRRTFSTWSHKTGGLFDAQSGAGAHMQPDQTGIHRRKEIFSQDEHQPQRQNAECEEAGGKQLAMLQRKFQQLFIAAAEIFESSLEAALEAPQGSLRHRRLCARAHA